MQQRQNHADVHSDDEINHHGEAEGDKQNHHIRLRCRTRHPNEVFHFTHVPSHDEENRCKRTQGDLRGERCKQYQNQYQGCAVCYTSHRTVGAVAKVGRGSGDCPGGGNATKERRQHVGDALPDKFLIRIVPRAGHAIGDNSRQHGFDSTEHRDGEGCRQQQYQLVNGDGRQGEVRQTLWDATERAADCRNAAQREDRLERRCHDHRDQWTRHTLQARCARRDDDQRQTEHRHCSRWPIQLRKGCQQRPGLDVEMLAVSFRQTEEVTPLPHPDDDANARSESGDHRVRDKADDCAEARDAQEDQHHAGHERREQQSVNAELRRNACKDDDEGAGRTGDLNPRAAEQRDANARNDRGIDSLFGLYAGCDRKCHRKG